MFNRRKNDVDGKYLEMEAWNTNIDLFDIKDHKWKLNPTTYSARTIEDIYALLKTGDHKLPDNKIPPTKRDIVFIALLTGMETSHHSKKKQELLRWFTQGYGIPKEEVENGVRNVQRKNLLRNQYTHYATMDVDKEFLTINFDDTSKKVIPFLGEVLPSLSQFWIQVDAKMTYGRIFAYHPPYLSCPIRNLIETSMKEHDVNGEIFVIHSWGFGQPGSILQLVPDE